MVYILCFYIGMDILFELIYKNWFGLGVWIMLFYFMGFYYGRFGGFRFKSNRILDLIG